MIMQEYQAKREVLERRMEEVGTRESEHKMELSARHSAELQRIASQIGQLKHQRAELNKKYETDKAYLHRKYREEKKEIKLAMHYLKLQYQTENPPPPTAAATSMPHNEKGGDV